MLEQTSTYSADNLSQRVEHNQSTESDLYGLNKIIAVGYDQNKSLRLPISRYSLKVSVIGLSATGVASGIGLAALGHKVIAVDHVQRKVNALNQGRVSSTDLKLRALVKQVRRLNNVIASGDLHHAILSTELSLVCIGNNYSDKTTYSDKMSTIVEQISATLQSKRDFHLIVICQPIASADMHNCIGSDIEKSTGKTLGKDFGLCFVPLVLKQHQELSDFYTLPNMTVTVSDSRSEILIGKLFNGFNNKIKYIRYIKM